MKINITNILLGGLLIILLWQNYTDSTKDVKPPIIKVTIPEKQGSTQKIIEKYYPSYINSGKTQVIVDDKWKIKYEKAKDSIEKQKLYYESIKINNVKDTIVNNDTISIIGDFTTRGKLLNYDVKYKLKKFDFEYVPEIIYKRPRMSVGFGVETGVSLGDIDPFIIKGDISVENSKGNNFSIGYDSKERVWIGFKKTIKIW